MTWQTSWLILLFFFLWPFSSNIDISSTKPIKVNPLPHMYVVKDLVPVRE